MVLYVNIALAYCKLERWTPVFFCYKILLFSIQSYLRCSSVWYPPHTRVKKSKRKLLTKYTQTLPRVTLDISLLIICSISACHACPSSAAISRRPLETHMVTTASHSYDFCYGIRLCNRLKKAR